jgi:hypothetical protein
MMHLVATKIINSLAPEFSTQCTLQKIEALNGHSLLSIFLADDLGDVRFSQHHCVLTEFIFQHQRIKPIRHVLEGLL